eukprot:g4737.t1
MEGHATRPDLQEAVCDLLWSLAFNNGLVKEVVGRQGGIALILKGMSSHLSSPELIKSACGALSNMCQNTYNQNLIAAHGGVRTILSALQSHRMNAPLLPFVFDALASLIVGNQRNGLLVTDGGGIRGVLATMALHSDRREVVKSGCHTLAILSDIQGQGARIAGADGVKVLLPALRAHVRFLHLHRIAAIVLLRMLQEAAVARDIASYGGVVIMLGMLREHAREEETVAATVHILYLITHADVMRGEVEIEVQALVSEVSALPTVLQCLALHTTSRGITDSAVAVAGALLAAAHEGGWASSRDSPGGPKGGGNQIFTTGTSTDGGAGHSKLLVLGTTPNDGSNSNSNTAVNHRGHQQHRSFLQQQHQHHQQGLQATATVSARNSEVGIGGVTPMPTDRSGGNNNNLILRFAYAPLQDNRSGGTTQGVPAKGATLPATAVGGNVSSGGGAGKRGGGAGGGGGSASGSWGALSNPATADAAVAAVEAARIGISRAGSGDVGGWNASMQALCAMLRARRRDPTLAGLVFLALKACIIEWANACDAVGGAPSDLNQQQLAQREQTIVARGRSWRGYSSSPGAFAETAAAAAAAGIASNTGAANPHPATAGITGAGRNAASDHPNHQSDVVGSALSLVGVKGGQWENKEAAELTSTPRGKMHLGIRESLKAGLVWAESVPLYKAPATGMDGDRRGSAGDQAAAAVAAGEVSFSPAMAQAVERLCWLLDLGFAEMGFGRFGSAVPLGEATSLVAFDASVPEVLENLRAARQPSGSRECVEHLMRSFLPDDPPEPPPLDQDGDHADTTSTSSTAVANAGSVEQASDIALAGGQRASSGSLGPGHAGDENNNDKTSGGSGQVGTPGNARGGGGAFVDEAAAGGAGLLLASPRHLEPFLLPSSSSMSPLMATSSTTDLMSAVVTNPPDGPARGRVQNGGPGSAESSQFVGSMSEVLPSKYPSGVSGGGGGAMTTDERLWLVYEGVSAAGKGVISKINAPDPYWLGRAPAGAVCPHQHSMEFCSSFESANLLRAVQRGPAEYDLFLRPDLHTHGHTQWFYFAVRDTHPPGVAGDTAVKFNVVNLTKPDSLFAMGMRPVMYSHQEADEKGLGWRRCGHDIDYRSNGYSWYKPDGSHASFYTLSLTVTFPNPGDTYRLAHAHPYSYSDHKRHLAGLLANERTSRYLTHTVLCTTLGGNECDLLTVTDFQDTPITATGGGSSISRNGSFGGSSPSSGQQQQNQQQQQLAGAEIAGGAFNGNNFGRIETPDTALTASAVGAAGGTQRGGGEGGGANHGGGASEDGSTGAAALGIGARYSGGGGSSGGGTSRRGNNKRCVVISARVHPGETPASWMMRGMLDFITGDSAEARLLRSLFVFKIVPMLNPDGVAFGNNRCSLAGVDLNRQWKRPSRALHPTVFWLKQHIRQEQAKKGVAMYIDLHGHSRKMNIFMYGADEKRRGVSCPSARVFPKLLSWNRLGRKYVSFKDCSFAVKKGREATARVVVARDLGIGNSYTVESTFCGVDFGPLKNHHLNTDHLQEAGVAICDALLDYYLPNQVQRERAHRDLMTRDGLQESRLGLVKTPAMNGAIAAAVVAGAGDGISAAAESDSDGRDEAGVRDSETGDGRGDEDGERRDVDDDVVDNNDDIESEDDNDSADAAEADGSPEEADTDNPPPDADPLLPSSPSPRSTPSSAADRPTDACCKQRGGAVRESEADNDVSPGPPKRCDGRDAGGDRDSGSSGGGNANVSENTSDGVAGEDRPHNQHSLFVNANGRGGGGEGRGEADGETTNTPWTEIEWGQGEGETGGAVRRWGRAVQEGEDNVSTATFASAGEAEPPPMTGEVVSRERRKEERESPSLDRGLDRTDLTGEGGSNEAAQTATTLAKGVAGEPPPRSGGRSKKERRRASGSRAPKALVLGNGNRGKSSSDRSIQRQRPRGGNGDDAARRASDAALQAASSVLATCASSSSSRGPIAKSRRRIRSLPDSGRFTPDNGGSGGGGSGTSRGSTSSTSSRGGTSRGRNRGGSSFTSRGGLAGGSPSAAGSPESAPRSGSSLVDAPPDGGGDVATAVVVKRGGNLRWINPTNTSSGGVSEGSWNGLGSLPPNFAQRTGPGKHSPFERGVNNAEASTRHQTELSSAAPELGQDGAARGSGVGVGSKGAKSNGDVGGVRGRVVKGRGVIGIAGVGGNGEKLGDECVPALFALPVLEDGGGSGGTGSGGAGIRGIGGRKIQATR